MGSRKKSIGYVNGDVVISMDNDRGHKLRTLIVFTKEV